MPYNLCDKESGLSPESIVYLFRNATFVFISSITLTLDTFRESALLPSFFSVTTAEDRAETALSTAISLLAPVPSAAEAIEETVAIICDATF